MKLCKFIALALASTLSLSCFAAPTIQGQWQTTDKKTNQPSSIISIRKHKQAYIGTITKVFAENGHKVGDVCKNCKGSLHNKPILNMNILHVRLSPTGATKRCAILDPQVGKTYHCKLKLADNGQTLKLRGYIGFSLIGRTDSWQRVIPKDKNKA